MQNSRTPSIQRAKTLTFCAMFVALVAVCAQITVAMPSGISFTLQTFAIALCGYLLGVKYGALVALVYLLLGAVGLPIFSAFRGGFYVLFGVTGGYIWGFMPMAALCGLAANAKRKILPYVWGIPALLVCYFCGTVQFVLLTGTDFKAVLLLCVTPYIWKDILSLAAAAILAGRLRGVLKHFGFPPQRVIVERAQSKSGI
ncbi:MAG: biotin transporter BioY [Oscillospiraceae bacterium]|nr:biotin transporter BioY [Oscillospiraceae bacterium]